MEEDPLHMFNASPGIIIENEFKVNPAVRRTMNNLGKTASEFPAEGIPDNMTKKKSEALIVENSDEIITDKSKKGNDEAKALFEEKQLNTVVTEKSEEIDMQLKKEITEKTDVIVETETTSPQKRDPELSAESVTSSDTSSYSYKSYEKIVIDGTNFMKETYKKKFINEKGICEKMKISNDGPSTKKRKLHQIDQHDVDEFMAAFDKWLNENKEKVSNNSNVNVTQEM